MSTPNLFPALYNNIRQFEEAGMNAINEDRRLQLKKLSDYIINSKHSHRKVQLLFICTHNSRRSHIAQIWAHTFARYFYISEIFAYSGGTEATAFHPNAIAAMQRFGFQIEAEPGYKSNPRHRVSYGDPNDELVCYSKLYNEPPNPEGFYAAVMVCSDADANCPVIPGVEQRIPLTYEDPKNYDGTDKEEQMYDQTCRLIGQELHHCFRKAAQQVGENT